MAGDEEGLLDELTLGSGAGGRRKRAHMVSAVVRELGEADVPELLNPTNVPVVKTVENIKHSHHQLAQLLAKGLSNTEISGITGYSPAWISNIKNSPMVAELIDHYATQRSQLFVDVAERLKSLGLNAIEELQQRLADDPAGWTKRELQELAKMTLIEGAPAKLASPAGHGSGAAPVALTINFVKPQAKADEAFPVIDQNGREILNG